MSENEETQKVINEETEKIHRESMQKIDTEAILGESPPPPKEITMDPKLATFIHKHHVRFSMWNKANGNTNFPIIKDQQGEYRWLNRYERRNLLLVKKK